MNVRASRKTPSPAAGHDYSLGYGPALDGPGRSGGRSSGSPGGYQRAPRPFGARSGGPVGFAEAVRRFDTGYARFSGRAGRSEYWWVMLYQLGVALTLSAVTSTVGSSPGGEFAVLGLVLALVAFAFGLANLVPGLAVTVRRLHDVDLSGWFYLLILLPIIGGFALLVLVLLPSRPQGARFDR